MKRKNKVITSAGVGLGLLSTGALIILNKLEISAYADFERRRKDMLQAGWDDKNKCVDVEPIPTLTAEEKEKISDIIKGMSESEVRVVLTNIPVGLMFDEVLARMAMYDNFASSIQDSLKYLPK